MKTGENKEIVGETKLVTGSSSFIILFYCVFIKQVIDGINKTAKGKTCSRSLQPR
jgi:hypothetical protein